VEHGRHGALGLEQEPSAEVGPARLGSGPAEGRARAAAEFRLTPVLADQSGPGSIKFRAPGAALHCCSSPLNGSLEHGPTRKHYLEVQWERPGKLVQLSSIAGGVTEVPVTWPSRCDSQIPNYAPVCITCSRDPARVLLLAGGHCDLPLSPVTLFE
jgi:hypothetical protein